MSKIVCTECKNTFEADVTPRRGAVCFRCHLKTVSIGFTYGKEEFHGPTIGERARQQEEQAAQAGIKAEPVGQRWV